MIRQTVVNKFKNMMDTNMSRKFVIKSFRIIIYTWNSHKKLILIKTSEKLISSILEISFFITQPYFPVDSE